MDILQVSVFDGDNWGEPKVLAGEQGPDNFIRVQLVSATLFLQQAQDFEVEPDQRDHQAEGGIPLHVLGGARLGSSLDKVKIQHEIERCDDDNHDADSNTQRT